MIRWLYFYKWWNPFCRFHPLRLRFAGWSDGRANFPKSSGNSDSLPILNGLCSLGNQMSAVLVQKCNKKIQKLAKGANSTNSDWKKITAEISKENLILTDAESAYAIQHKQSPGEEPSHFWFWLILAILFCAELPLTEQIFLLFQLDTIETYLISLLPTIILMGTAHWFGSYLREKELNLDWKWPDLAKIFLGLGMPMILLFGITYVRSQYLHEVLQAHGYYWPFVIIATAGYLTAVIFSYRHYNCDSDLDKIWAFRRQIKKLNKKESKIQSKLNNFKSKLNMNELYIRSVAQSITNQANELLSIYVGTNLKSRTDESIPSCLLMKFDFKLVKHENSNEFNGNYTLTIIKNPNL